MWLQALVRTSGALLGAGALLLAFWWLYVVLLPYRQITDGIAPLAVHRPQKLTGNLHLEPRREEQGTDAARQDHPAGLPR